MKHQNGMGMSAYLTQTQPQKWKNWKEQMPSIRHRTHTASLVRQSARWAWEDHSFCIPSTTWMRVSGPTPSYMNKKLTILRSTVVVKNPWCCYELWAFAIYLSQFYFFPTVICNLWDSLPAGRDSSWWGHSSNHTKLFQDHGIGKDNHGRHGHLLP